MNTERILYEDNDIIVCHKPAGIATQTAKVGIPDMVSEIKGYLAGKNRTQGPYMGLIHRLDQPVEGILVFAKNKKAAANLSAQVQDSRMEKYYLAVVRLPESEILVEDSIGSKDVLWESIPENNIHKEFKPERTLTDYLYQDKSTNTSYVVDEGKPGAKLARLSYQMVEKQVVEISDAEIRMEESGASAVIALLRIHLLTGRHHQIRVQFTNTGYSLLGDHKYADEGTKAISGVLGQKQVALCAYELAFLHPATGKRLEFRILPEGEIFHKFKFNE